jgi:hypothetical protein
MTPHHELQSPSDGVAVLDADRDAKIAANECILCGCEIWSCICDPTRRYRHPTPDEIEAARRERLMRRERRGCR